MIDHLIATSLTPKSWPGGLAWTLVWQSTVWLAIGLLAGRIWRRRAGRAHLLLVLATCAAVISPLLTATVRRMEWGVLPPPPSGAISVSDTNVLPTTPAEQPIVKPPLDWPLD